MTDKLSGNPLSGKPEQIDMAAIWPVQPSVLLSRATSPRAKRAS